jgi:uncharacterized protein YfiM (DUF2279 family)
LTKSLGYKKSKFAFPLKVGLFCLAIWFIIGSQQTRADGFSSEKTDSVNLSSYANKDEWLGSDKVAHFTISLFLSAITYKMYHDNYYNDKNPSILFSGGFVFTLGLGKEFYDRRRPNGRFSYKDLIADAAGISIGLILATNH